MESIAHGRLKLLTLAYLRREGFLAAACEVRCPGSRYRVDVAAWLDRTPWPRETIRQSPTLWSTVPLHRRSGRSRACEPRTVIVECKQSRSDFIRDGKHIDELAKLRDEATQWLRHIEEHRIKPHEPELRISDSALFSELEEWDFNATRLQSYRRLQRRIRRLEQQMYGETKFSLMSRYRLADQLFIAAPRGLIRRRELPTGWGLLEWPRDLLASRTDAWEETDLERAKRSIEAPHTGSKPDFRNRLLRNIAIAATRDSLRVKSTRSAVPAQSMEAKPEAESRTQPRADDLVQSIKSDTNVSQRNTE